MLIVFSPILVAETKIIFCYNFVLTNQKPEKVIRNCQWNTTCNTAVIHMRRVTLPPCQFLKLSLR